VIRMTAGRVQVVTATPSPGYTVETAQDPPDNLAVYVTKPEHYFVIHAIWWDGRPSPRSARSAADHRR